MPKTYTAQSITHINPIQVIRTEGVVTGLVVNCDVNYGELGMQQEVDIWEDLTPTQKTKVVSIYNFIKAKVEDYFLGG